MSYISHELPYSIFHYFHFRSIVFGPPGNSKGPLLFFFVNLLCWGYPMYVFKVRIWNLPFSKGTWFLESQTV